MMKRNHSRAWVLMCLAGIFTGSLFFPGAVSSADRYWVGGSGSWDNASNWSFTIGGPGGAGPPEEGDSVFLIQSDDIDRTVVYADDGVRDLIMYIDATGSGTMFLYQSQGSLTYYRNYIGYSGTGRYDLAGGHLVVDGLLYIGYSGKGTFNHIEGGVGVPDGAIYLGYTATGEGTYNMGGGSCSGFEYDLYVGCSGKGTYNQSSGVHGVGWTFQLGRDATGKGTYNLSGGYLYVGWSCSGYAAEIIGGLGEGTFNQTGGEHIVVSVIPTGLLIGADGTYNLKGGMLTVHDCWFSSDALIVNNNSFNYSGGELNSSMTNNGTMTLSGSGIRTVNGDVTNNGTIKVTDTIAQFVGTFTNYGTFVSDPALNFFADLIIEDGTMEGTGADLWYIDGGLLGVDIQDTTVGNILGPPGMKVYYLASVPENAYLRGLVYELIGGGHLLPTLREPYEVNVDIKPESEVNRINLKSKGAVPVAVLTTESFDADDVDPDTCFFAGSRPRHWAMEYVDDDYELDMLIHFDTEELNLRESSTEAFLTGETLDGTPIWGADMVDIVPK